MAAIQAAGQGASVTVLEHNETPGKKLLATGNGRCNLTNEALKAEFYHCGRTDFPMEVIRQFPLEDTLQFFEKLGISLKNRRGGYIPAVNRRRACWRFCAWRQITGRLR